MAHGFITTEIEPEYQAQLNSYSSPYTAIEYWSNNKYIEFKAENTEGQIFYFIFDQGTKELVRSAPGWLSLVEIAYCVPQDNDQIRVIPAPQGAYLIPMNVEESAMFSQIWARDPSAQILCQILFKPAHTRIFLSERPGWREDQEATHPYLQSFEFDDNSGQLIDVRRMYFSKAGSLRPAKLVSVDMSEYLETIKNIERGLSHEPTPPLTQYRATSPITGDYIFVQYDKVGMLISYCDPTGQTVLGWSTGTVVPAGFKGWIPLYRMENEFAIKGLGEFIKEPYPFAEEWVPCLNEDDQVEVHNYLVQSPLIKERSQYIIIGDEPDVAASAVIDIKASMKPEEVGPLKELFTHMPRMYLYPWFLENVIPKMDDSVVTQSIYEKVISQTPDSPLTHEAVISAVSKAQVEGGAGQQTYKIAEIYGWEFLRPKRLFEDMTWAGFIDFFNECNLEYCNQKQIEPWAWEDEKLKAYYVSQDEPQVQQFLDQMKSYEEINLAQDPKVVELLSLYQSLPPLGDPGLEINRQNSVRELLARGEYDAVKGIIEAYRSAQYTVFSEVINKPIPFDITTEDGEIIKMTPSNQGE